MTFMNDPGHAVLQEIRRRQARLTLRSLVRPRCKRSEFFRPSQLDALVVVVAKQLEVSVDALRRHKTLQQRRRKHDCLAIGGLDHDTLNRPAVVLQILLRGDLEAECKPFIEKPNLTGNNCMNGALWLGERDKHSSSRVKSTSRHPTLYNPIVGRPCWPPLWV